MRSRRFALLAILLCTSAAARAFAAASLTPLGDLPGGEFESVAEGVSGDGSVVVGYNSLYPSPGSRAFYWTADDGMRALWDLLLSHGVDPAADGWTELYSAEGISADGNTIVGSGLRNGNGEAFVAVIPVVPQPGDYSGNGLVEQADLDLVLSTWGAETPPVPANWINDLPQGPIDQTELDNVLLNWGNTSAADANASATAAVPEPSGLDLLALSAGVLILTGRRIRRGESEPEHSGQSRSGR